MDLVLDEEVHQRYDCSEKTSCKDLAVFDGLYVRRAQNVAAIGPRNGSDQVRDHEDVVPVMVVGGSNVGPTTAGQGAKDANAGDKLG